MSTATYYHPEKLIPIDLLISSIQDELAPHLESKSKLSSTTDSNPFDTFILFLEYVKNTLLSDRSPKYHTILWTFTLNKVVVDFCYLISKHNFNLSDQKESQLEKSKKLTINLFKAYFSDLSLGYIGTFRYNQQQETEEPAHTSFNSNNLILKKCFPLFRNVLMLANNMFYNLGLTIHYTQMLVDTIEKFQFGHDASYLFTSIVCLTEKNICELSSKGVSASDKLAASYHPIKERMNFDNLSFELYEKYSVDYEAINEEYCLEIEKNRIQRFYDDIICFYYYRSLNSLFRCSSDAYINFTKLIKILAIDKEMNIAQVKSSKYSSQKRSHTDAKSKISNEATYQTLPKIESTYFKSHSKRVELSKSFLLMNGLITDNLPHTTNVKDLRRHNLNPSSGDISKLLDATKDFHFIFDKDLVFNFIICAYYSFPDHWRFLEKNYAAIRVSSGFTKAQFGNVFTNLKPKLENYKSQDIFSEYLGCVETILQFYGKSEIDDFQIDVIESLKRRDLLYFAGKVIEYGIDSNHNEMLYQFLVRDFFEVFFINFVEFKFNNGFEKISLNWITSIIDHPDLQIEDVLILDDSYENVTRATTNSIWTLMQTNLAISAQNSDLLPVFLHKIVQHRKQEWEFDGEVLFISKKRESSEDLRFTKRAAECCYKLLDWNSEMEYISNI